jgi:hypothetical protein
VPGITPEGTASTGKSGENLIPNDTNERLIFARRIVAQRCLYGVDKNPLAAEMAKLSLWLLTLQKDKPFTFLDHAIRSGDSLVGIANTHQLTSFSLDEKGIDMPMFTDAIKKRLDAVRLLRRQISELPDNSAEDVQKKALMLRNAEEQTKRLAYAANFLLAAYWESTSETDRDERLKQALVGVEYKFKDLPPEQLEVEGGQRLQKAGCPWPLHWPLEFPEVFMERGGFDVVVGNPPFLGGSRISTLLGDAYMQWLLNSYEGCRGLGRIDLSAFFFRRAFSVLSSRSAVMGLLATNTISQGDTRVASLDYLSTLGATIIKACRSFVWPGQGPCRTWIYCGDMSGNCPFSRRLAPEEGLPVMVVDEEIYRRLPTLLIATVDKFAQMPWNGAVQMLFGQVNGHCSRHGFRSPEIQDSDSHPRTKTGLPPAATQPHGPLRPPDLIIQDELHLISGPLGTLVGLYETAIDKLCTWEVNGKKVRPKVVASTATIRNADVQVHKLFLRKLNIFPAHGLDVRDNFFSLQREPGEKYPGRRYMGVCAPGRRVKAALIRVYVAQLCAAQALYEQYGADADPWMTLVGYFNSMRELGGVRRLVFDDVTTRTKKMDRRGLAKRMLVADSLEELTSRMRSEQIPEILDRLEAVFDPEIEAKRKELLKKREFSKAPKKPISLLLATNMVSVGVDVKRLGLMVVCSQPKTTAEYIQATSRVGRNKPGLVCTVFNWARPRDMSHYETFEHYHSTFYKHVEALSVTPFSPGALHRGLAGLLVSLVRMRGFEFNANDQAVLFQADHPYVCEAIEVIARRAGLVGDGPEVADFVRAELQSKVDLWKAEAENRTGGRMLAYDTPRGEGKAGQKGTTVELLHRPGLEKWEEFTCLNSLREVEPTVKLIVDDGGLDDLTDEVTAIPEANIVDGEDEE